MRCSAEVKQKGAVQRPGLGSRLQQEIVLQNSLKTIKTKIQLMMKRTDMSFIHDAINSPSHPVTLSFIHPAINSHTMSSSQDHGPCHPFTVSSIHRLSQSPCHSDPISSYHPQVTRPKELNQKEFLVLLETW